MSTHIPEFITDEPATRKTSTGWVSVLLIVLVAGFCLASGRDQPEHAPVTCGSHTVQTSQNLLEAETGGMEQVLAMYDASLRGAADAIGNPALRYGSPRNSAAWRSSAMSGACPISGRSVSLDAGGGVLYDQSTPAP